MTGAAIPLTDMPIMRNLEQHIQQLEERKQFYIDMQNAIDINIRTLRKRLKIKA